MSLNPPWVEDELLLVLDLYLQERRVLEEYDPAVTEVSALLNRLPIHPEAGGAGFRTPDAVVLKLANFRSYDPLTDARGMSNAGRRAAEVWHRYAEAPQQVGNLAEALRAAAERVEDRGDAVSAPEPDEQAVPEGRLLYRCHRRRERDPSLRGRKLKQLMAASLVPACEVCRLSPYRVFGPRCDLVLECHHLRPLALGERTTRLSDTALVCANCHRALHTLGLLTSLEELRAILPSGFVAAMSDPDS